jgi:hypothetical protein
VVRNIGEESGCTSLIEVVLPPRDFVDSPPNSHALSASLCAGG